MHDTTWWKRKNYIIVSLIFVSLLAVSILLLKINTNTNISVVSGDTTTETTNIKFDIDKNGSEALVSMSWNGHDLSEIFPDAFAEWSKKPLSPVIDYESGMVSVAMKSPDGGKEMTAYLTLFYSDDPDYLELYYFNWAIDTTDMNTLKFKFLCDNAFEAWCWFEGLGWLDVDYDYPNKHNLTDDEVIYDGNFLTWRGNMFSKVSDIRWDNLGIKSLAGLESYLSTIFAPDVMNMFMAKCDGGHYSFNYNETNAYPVFAEFEGAVWKNEVTREWNANFRNPRYYITESSESRIVLTCEVENFNNNDYILEYYEFPFEQIDGKWLLTDFPRIW